MSAAFAALLSAAAVSAVSAQSQNDQSQNGQGQNGQHGSSLLATPELDSVLLFGTGLAGIVSYAALRRRARR